MGELGRRLRQDYSSEYEIIAVIQVGGRARSVVEVREVIKREEMQETFIYPSNEHLMSTCCISVFSKHLFFIHHHHEIFAISTVIGIIFYLIFFLQIDSFLI